MLKSVIYTRVSSKEQEEEGFSIPAQRKLLLDYALKHDFQVIREFVDVETAKQAGRGAFNEMILYLKEMPSIKAVLVEKTDRLYRNFRDYVTVDDLGLEIHLVKEGEVLSRDSKSHQKFIHGIKVLMAKNFIDNLSEETKKGLTEKAESGFYPGLAPLGYKNVADQADVQRRTVILDGVAAPIVKEIFAQYATGRYSLLNMRDYAHKMGVRSRTGKPLHKSRIEKMLKDIFYTGDFMWAGKRYRGKHPAIITPELFQQVQIVFQGKGKSKGSTKPQIAYIGILNCGYCGCAITGEHKKKKSGREYVYYRCTNYHKNCPAGSIYYTEQTVDDLLSDVILDLRISEGQLRLIRQGLKQSREDEKAYVDGQISLLNDRRTLLRKRLDKIYDEHIDGKIDEDFYEKKRVEWDLELREVESQLKALTRAERNYYDLGTKFLELAEKLHHYWQLQDNRLERGKLIKILLSNCAIKDGTLCPVYRKPFDLIVAMLKNENWGPFSYLE